MSNRPRLRPQKLHLTATERAALACPDCNADLEATRVGPGLLHLRVSHDSTCPWLRRVSCGQPFLLVEVFDGRS